MSVAMDEFFPMAEGPGGDTRMAQWRRMASLWCPAGVVRGVGGQLQFLAWVDSETVAFDGGACWVNGFYGEMPPGHHTWLPTPGNNGLVVAEYDPFNQAIKWVYIQNAHGATQDPNTWWQLPLWDIYGPDDIRDLRTFVPPPLPPPPVADVPEPTPRGVWWLSNSPGTEVIATNGTLLDVAYPFTQPGFVSGRSFRFTAYHDGSGATANIGQGDGQDRYWCDLWVRDDIGMRYRLPMNQASRAAIQGGQGSAGTASVVMTDVRDGVVGVIELRTAAGTMEVRIPAGSCRLEIDDVGRA